MRVLELDGASALASILIDAKLLGAGAIKYGSPDLVLFDSGGPASHLARNSILCGPSNTRIVIRQSSNKTCEKHNNALEGQIELIDEKPVLTAETEEWKHGCWYHSNIISAAGLGDLMNKLKQLSPCHDFVDAREHLPSGTFWAGSIAYDMVQFTQPISFEKSPKDNDVLAIFWLIENYVIRAVENGEYTVYGTDEQWVEAVKQIVDEEKITVTLPLQLENNNQEVSSINDEQHRNSIQEIKDSIANGMFYQVNFGRFWSGRLVEHPLTIYQRLTVTNPAPFSAYVEAVDLGLAIVSSSPETLLRCNNRFVSSAPIKGTVTRGANKSEDLAMVASMIADIKERSEHRMLVDLMRNDLSSICKVGTVNIAQFDVESYANVHHLVSHIKGELLDEKTSGDALDAIFPGGSITGCPRTMVCAAIDQVEHSNRSFWTGSVGWFDPHNDNCSWNILIRTLEAHKKGNRWEGVVGAGGGITIRSDPDLEVAESIWKSQAIRKACGWLKPDFDLTNSGQLETTALDIENSFNFTNCGSVTMLDDLDSNQIKNNVMIIDNLDSFTLNIAHVIAGLGHDVCVVNGRDVKFEDYTESNFLVDYFREHAPSHIVLGPGPGKPQDSKLTMKVAQLAIDGLLNVPLLGVCLGHQAIGLVDGYQLIKDPNGAVHGTPVTCQSDGSGLFASSTSKSSQFVRYNSLIVTGEGKNKLIPNVYDENGSIMGLRHKTKPIHGVQFHPESIGSVNGIEIIMSFLALQSDA